MNRINYSLICIELASHGFIVMAVDHPGTSFTATPEGGTLAVEPNAGGPLGKIKEIQNDVRLILKELESKPEWERLIDWNKVGWIGHSIGGAAAVLVNPGELPVKAAVNMDGHLFKKASDIVLKVPSMAILQRPIFINGRVPDSLRQERSDYWKEISSQSKSLVSVYNLEGYFHLDFSDIPLIIPDSLRVKAGGTLAPKRGHQILSELLIGFFNKHLKSYHINYSNTVSYPELNSEFIP